MKNMGVAVIISLFLVTFSSSMSYAEGKTYIYKTTDEKEELLDFAAGVYSVTNTAVVNMAIDNFLKKMKKAKGNKKKRQLHHMPDKEVNKMVNIKKKYDKLSPADKVRVDGILK